MIDLIQAAPLGHIHTSFALLFFFLVSGFSSVATLLRQAHNIRDVLFFCDSETRDWEVGLIDKDER
ncbi:hypothetical protein SCA6_003766 [Theobroma cacao]